jgi:fatty acid desaturase
MKVKLLNINVGFFGLLTLIFITLKLLNKITWSWGWVLSPIIIPVIIVVMVILIVLLILGLALLTNYLDVKRFNREHSKTNKLVMRSIR